jgi:hypothetical protein
MKIYLLPLFFIIAVSSWAQNTSPWPSSGNIGIGTTNPGGKALHVRANSSGDHSCVIENVSSTGYGLILNSANDPLRVGPLGNYEGSYFKVSTSGNVGIGTTIPAAKLAIHGASASATNLILSANYPDQYRWRLNTNDRGHAIDLDFTASDDSDNQEVVLKLTRSNSERPEFQLYGDAIVSNNGQVGIGTSAPQARLHIIDGGFRHGGAGQIDIDAPGVIGGRLKILDNGNVGIGTTHPNQKLTVNGTIYGKEIKVDLNVPGPDYVFEPTYNLPTLAETEAYIKTHKHLPEVPSAKEMEANGINLSEMNMLLLKKVEELTLHIIKQERRIAELEKNVNKAK